MRNIFTLLALTLTILFSSGHDSKAALNDSKTLKIASWNLWDFADTHMGVFKRNISSLSTITATGKMAITHTGWACNYIICQGYADVIRNGDYDMVFVQEIRKFSRTNGFYSLYRANQPFPFFQELCDFYLHDYKCEWEYAGDNRDNGEGYGVIYKKSAFNNVYAYSSQEDGIKQGTGENVMTRPPMVTIVEIANQGDDKQFIFYNNHLKYRKEGEPPYVEYELATLENHITSSHYDERKVAVLGDLNADCSPYPQGRGGEAVANFQSWKWLIANGSIGGGTNFGQEPCIYDRFIINNNMHAYTDTISYPYLNVVSTIPYKIENIGSDDIDIPSGTSFKSDKWNGTTSTNQSYGLSDHKLIWFNLSIGGIESNDLVGRTKLFPDKDGENCDILNKVYVQGKGFPLGLENKNTYIVPFDDVKENMILADKHVAATTYSFTDGIIDTGEIWSPIPGEYNTIIDMNNDGKYNFDHDLIDAHNNYGFRVIPCLKSGNQAAVNMAALLFLTTMSSSK